MREKRDPEKALPHLYHMGGAAFVFYYDSFASSGILMEDAGRYENVTARFLAELLKSKTAMKNVRLPFAVVLDAEDVTVSLGNLKSLYEKTGFRDKNSSGLTRNSVAGILRICCFTA
ncbi:hypothetical protein FGB62_71g215 [Gracilaria domingensis]|nr:hypothetical protein FGB62_71g215 [Gracilaria domingensis]